MSCGAIDCFAGSAFQSAALPLPAPGDLFFSEKTEREFKVAGVLERTGTGDDGFFFIPLASGVEIPSFQLQR